MLITTWKHLIKELKVLKIFENSVLSIFNVYAAYLCKVTILLIDCFTNLIMYILDVFIAQMGLWCK